MASFSNAVEEMVGWFYEDAPAAAAEVEYVRDMGRLIEAEEVQPLVDAFARAELDPHNKGLGIFGAKLIPGVGHQLRKRFSTASPEQMRTAARGIVRALAVGYVGVMAIEQPNGFTAAPDPDLRDVWRLTVCSFRTGALKDLGLPPDTRGAIERNGEMALATDLREAGLLGVRTGRIGLVGRDYGAAGAMLRIGQNDAPRSFELQLAEKGFADKWPFEDYVDLDPD